MVYMMIAFGHALRPHLRDSDPQGGLGAAAGAADLELAIGVQARAERDPQHAATARLGAQVRAGAVSHQLALAFLERLGVAGRGDRGCERIRLTPLPFAYTLLLHRTGLSLLLPAAVRADRHGPAWRRRWWSRSSPTRSSASTCWVRRSRNRSHPGQRLPLTRVDAGCWRSTYARRSAKADLPPMIERWITALL
jgi:hypothetical protein